MTDAVSDSVLGSGASNPYGSAVKAVGGFVMHASRPNDRLLFVMAVALGAVLFLALSDPVSAQPAAPNAELNRVIGRVEGLRKGQTQWAPAGIGDRLGEGDDIPAFPGAPGGVGVPANS